ncbi:MAG TPA: BLUF domain-containing protein [Lacipirellulaceae bacterium]|nr:BLUF domain-containing protein [Lacipirellulaceae bacterium]
MSLSHLIYISQSCINPQRVDAELDSIRRAASRNNAAVEVTGLLLYNAGCFLQLLEGEDRRLVALYDRLAEDQRHSDLQRLIFQDAEVRLFPGWEMGVVNLDQASALEQRRFASLAGACRLAPRRAQIAQLYQEFRRQLPAMPAVAQLELST